MLLLFTQSQVAESLGSVASFGASRFELEFIISDYGFLSFRAINKGSLYRGCKASLSVRGPSQVEKHILFSGRCDKQKQPFTSTSAFKGIRILDL